MEICIFAASSDKVDPRYGEAVKSFGELAAEAGHGIVYGGGRGGLMGKCAKACFNKGGRVTGIAPGFFDIPGVLMKSCGEFILTDTMAERKELMVSKSDAFVLLPGGIGSLDEFFEVLTLKQLGKIDKPIVILNTSGYYDKMLEFLKQMAEEKFLGSDCMGIFKVCSEPEEIIPEILRKDPETPYCRRIADYNR